MKANRRQFLTGLTAVAGATLMTHSAPMRVIADVVCGPVTRPGRHLTRHWYPKAFRNLIVYSKRTGERRRVIDPEDDAELAFYVQTVRPGEGYFLIGHKDYDAFTNPHDLNDHIARMAGFEREPDPSEGRYAVVSPAGKVVNVVQADHACGDCGADFGPGFLLLPHPRVDVGWQYRGGMLYSHEVIS